MTIIVLKTIFLNLRKSGSGLLSSKPATALEMVLFLYEFTFNPRQQVDFSPKHFFSRLDSWCMGRGAGKDIAEASAELHRDILWIRMKRWLVGPATQTCVTVNFTFTFSFPGCKSPEMLELPFWLDVLFVPGQEGLASFLSFELRLNNRCHSLHGVWLP